MNISDRSDAGLVPGSFFFRSIGFPAARSGCARARTRLPAILSTVLLVLSGCTQIQDVRELADGDLHPPALVSAELVDTTTAEIRLNKEARAVKDAFTLDPDGTIQVNEEPGHTLTVEFSERTEPGERYTLVGAAEDENGNSLQFVVYLYGYNPDIPTLQINEFSTRASANHPEIVELLVLEDGNLGGVTITNGTTREFTDRYIFPGIDVSAGDYLLVHFRPEGESYEIDELGEDLDESGGLNAHSEARDLWVDGASGLPATTGWSQYTATPAAGYSMRSRGRTGHTRATTATAASGARECSSGWRTW